MAKISFSVKFIKETLMLFRSRPLKELFFGKKTTFIPREEEVLRWIKGHNKEFREIGGRQGDLVRIDPIHKGVGTIYLLPNKLGDDKTESLIIFDENIKIIAGPDLWVYLSTSENVKKDGLGENFRLILLKGTKGGQTYVVNKPLFDLQKYKSLVIWCKQFEVLFTYAILR